METIHIDNDTSRRIDYRLAVFDDLQEQYELTGDEKLKVLMRDVAVEINNLLYKQSL